jgi:hypothetical protein
LVDLDGDGIADIISGSFPGELYLFRGLGHGRFAPRQTIKGGDGQAINVGGASTAFAADWDGDGKFDLIVGTIDGKVILIPNESKTKGYRFGTPRQLEADGKPIELLEGDIHPVAADWDRDGKVDLVVGTGSGSVLWYRNIGSRATPRLAAPQVLVADSPAATKAGVPLKDGQWGIRAKICMTDWNGDGWPDLLLGDYSYVTGAKTQRTDVDSAEAQKAEREWKRLSAAYLDAQQDLQTAEEPPAQETAAQKEARLKELGARRTRIEQLQRDLARAQRWLEMDQPSTQTHGYVWLFLRRPPQGPAKR